MSLGLVGRKCGMTRIFSEDGASTPVTVVEVEPNRVTRVKTAGSDGYSAVQVTCGAKAQNRVNRALAGEFKKAGVGAGRGLWEFRLSGMNEPPLNVGSELKVDFLAPVSLLTLSGPVSARDSPARLNAITLARRMHPTATRYLIVCRGRSVNARRRAVLLRVKRWQVTWVTSSAPHKILKLCVWIWSATSF